MKEKGRRSRRRSRGVSRSRRSKVRVMEAIAEASKEWLPIMIRMMSLESQPKIG